MDLSLFDQRPIIVALAGSNGAGKTTFYHSHLAETGLRFINADDLAAELRIEAYSAAELAAQLRLALIAKHESFIFETVLSDPVGDKVQLLQAVAEEGYQVVLIFIQIADAETSIQRVSMRVAQGGHDVPDEKLRSRFPRTQENLDRAIASLPHVIIFDNSDLAHPYRLVAVYQNGKRIDWAVAQQEHQWCVVLVGPSGFVKSTFACKHFLPTEVLLSDYCRGLVSDDASSQAATNDAFDVLYDITANRLVRFNDATRETNRTRRTRLNVVHLPSIAAVWLGVAGWLLRSLAIGPDEAERIDVITGQLQLL